MHSLNVYRKLYIYNKHPTDIKAVTSPQEKRLFSLRSFQTLGNFWKALNCYHFHSTQLQLSVIPFVWDLVCQSLSRVRLFATPWTVVTQAPLSMRFPRQEYWSGLPFPFLLFLFTFGGFPGFSFI